MDQGGGWTPEAWIALGALSVTLVTVLVTAWRVAKRIGASEAALQARIGAVESKVQGLDPGLGPRVDAVEKKVEGFGKLDTAIQLFGQAMTNMTTAFHEFREESREARVESRKQVDDLRIEMREEVRDLRGVVNGVKASAAARAAAARASKAATAPRS